MHIERQPEMPIPPPVFILASPHTESSLISAMLGRHPGLYAPPELNLFVGERLIEIFDALPSSRIHGLLRTIAQLTCGEQTLETIETAHRWLYRRIQQSTAAVHRELCQQVSPLQLIDSSSPYSDPNHQDALERIIDTYPDAYFLHLVRHPRTQGEAWLRSPVAIGQLFALDALDSTSRQRMPDPQIDWYRRQMLILDFLQEIPSSQWLRVRLEDSLNDPEAQFRTMIEWLDLDWSVEIFSAMLQPEFGSYSRPGPYGAEAGSDERFLRSPYVLVEQEKPETLQGLVPWRLDAPSFMPKLVELATSFGYE